MGGNDNLAMQFSAAFLRAQIVIAERERYGNIWPLLEIFNDRAREPMEVVNRYLDPVIRDAVGRYKEKKAAGGRREKGEEEGEETLLDHLVTLTSGWFFFFALSGFGLGVDENVDTALLRDETLNILIAARDTVRPSSSLPASHLCRLTSTLHVARRWQQRSHSCSTSSPYTPPSSRVCAKKCWIA